MDVFKGRAKLIAWRDRVKKGVGEKLFDEAHELLMKMSSMPPKMDEDKLEMLKSTFQKYLIWRSFSVQTKDDKTVFGEKNDF